MIGTGYSSLSYLRSFPLDILKIDRRFVTDVQQESGSRVIVESMIDLIGWRRLAAPPIEGMAKIAMDENAEPSLRAQMYKELAQYIAPKRKAVEMKADVGLSWIDVIRESYKPEYQPE
jgi:predicted signal transduction protein with EAL and GGDEF domain